MLKSPERERERKKTSSNPHLSLEFQKSSQQCQCHKLLWFAKTPNNLAWAQNIIMTKISAHTFENSITRDPDWIFPDPCVNRKIYTYRIDPQISLFFIIIFFFYCMPLSWSFIIYGLFVIFHVFFFRSMVSHFWNFLMYIVYANIWLFFGLSLFLFLFL